MSKKILVKPNSYAVVDDDNYIAFKRVRWQELKTGDRTYAKAHGLDAYGKRVSVLMHRIVFVVPHGMHVDHINGNGLDNRRENLRVCSCSENLMNRSMKRGSSKYKGVHWLKKFKRWAASITKDKKVIYLGRFKNEIDAAKAYDARAKILFGDFARLNLEGDRIAKHKLSNFTR